MDSWGGCWFLDIINKVHYGINLRKSDKSSEKPQVGKSTITVNFKHFKKTRGTAARFSEFSLLSNYFSNNNGICFSFTALV